VQVPFNGFGDLRNRAVEACRYEWIFSLDSDERCTEAVRDESLALVSGSPAHDAYRVPRRNYKHYFVKAGLIDGWAGFVIAFAYFEVTFYRYAKRYEATQKWGPPPSGAVRRS